MLARPLSVVQQVHHHEEPLGGAVNLSCPPLQVRKQHTHTHTHTHTDRSLNPANSLLPGIWQNFASVALETGLHDCCTRRQNTLQHPLPHPTAPPSVPHLPPSHAQCPSLHIHGSENIISKWNSLTPGEHSPTSYPAQTLR